MLKKVLKAFSVILIVFLVLFISIFAFHKITQKSKETFVSDNFAVYVKIKSISKLLKDFLDLKAAEVILPSINQNKLHKTLLELKSSGLINNKTFLKLLNLKSDIIVNTDLSAVIIADLGIKSVITRFLPLDMIIKSKKIKTSLVKKDKYKLYSLLIDQKTTLFLATYDNLLFIGFNQNDIENTFVMHFEKDNLLDVKELSNLDKQVSKSTIANIYLNSDIVSNEVKENYPGILNIFNKITLDKKTVLSFNLSNTNLLIEIFAFISVKSDKIRSFLDYKASNIDFINLLPENANSFLSINIKSLKEAFEIFLLFQDEKRKKSIIKIDSYLQNLFNLSLDDLLFSWNEGELGAFTSNISPNVIFFSKIKNKKKLNELINNLGDSFILKKGADLVFDGVRLDRLEFPEIIRSLMSTIIKGVDTPYFKIVDDYLFLSMNPQNLSDFYNRYKANQKLIHNDSFKKVIDKVELKSNLQFYFDLNDTAPVFLNKNNLLSKILKLYEKGVMSLNFNTENINLAIASYGEYKPKARIYPGFPKIINKGLKGQLLIGNITKAALPELIYLTSDNKLYITDVTNNVLEGWPLEVEEGAFPVLIKNSFTGYDDIIVFTKSGVVHKYNQKGEENSPFPLLTPYDGKIDPVKYDNKVFFFAGKENNGYFLSPDGKIEEFNFKFKTRLFSEPFFRENMIAFYPKSFSGEVFVTDLTGTVETGWPTSAGSISLSSPIIDDFNKKSSVLFLTQNGSLNIWNMKGISFDNFPVKLSGVYYTNPLVGNFDLKNRNDEIFVLAKSGEMSLINKKGEVYFSKDLKIDVNKETEVLQKDIDEDGLEEVFVFGGSNNIFGYTANFESLPGFPVKGAVKPVFYDLNNDGITEIITYGVDDNLYIYSLYK